MTNNKWVRFSVQQARDLLLAYTLSIVVVYFFMGNRLFSDIHTFLKNTQFGFLLAISIWKGNQFIGWFNSKKFPWNKNPKLTLSMDLILSIVYTGIAIFAVYFYVFQTIYKVNIQENFDWIFPQMAVTFLISIFITVLFYFVQFFKWWRVSIINEEKLKQETIQLRYDALKSNVNPHFLFNSLSVLSSLVDSDPAKAKEFIQQFSNIYRYVLEQREKELVAIDEEIRFIKSFTFLHQIRHGENLKVDIDVNETSGLIIPLSLQILLENCFKHNVISNEKPLTVKVWREDNYIIVQNNLQKRKTILDSGGIGLNTISKRYEFLSDKKMEIIVDSEYYTVKTPIIGSDKLK
ncbi:MAG TPA: histidine kinase [Tenuifilaceae bacterium]|nr:histidine kinase [Tenuifilaceae bacterium]HRX68102.1 histidine kinase [Tenuifilaceae bacterium]